MKPLSEPPTYTATPRKVFNEEVRRWNFWELLDAVFIVLAGAATAWLAWVLLREGTTINPKRIGYLFVFWIVVAYMALPRIHQLLTLLYVPNYFIGRTRTQDGLLGDPVNMGFQGNEAGIHRAMQKAGWSLADPITVRSAIKMVFFSISKRSYKKAPVSSLYLFDRMQNFAYQQEVDGNPHQRHHVRFYKCPEGWLLPGGRQVDWLAAGTFDRSVGFSLFTFQLTHRIDANIDIERDYIVDTLRWSDPSLRVEILEDFFTSYHHRNGGGDRIHTDGDLPIVHTGIAVEKPEDRQKHKAGQPPSSLIVSALLIALLTVGQTLISHFRNPLSLDMLSELWMDFSQDDFLFVLDYALTIVLVIFLVFLVVKGYSRARLSLEALLFFGIIFDLYHLTVNGITPDTSLMRVSVFVLALIALTSKETRDWVSLKSRIRRGMPAHTDQPSLPPTPPKNPPFVP
ncbi:MAG: LssY C-terminal domain-containing protein [Actinomycetaceae bacterium]|nr:LssY C-terminal domain-containing protein [Actinomycetaceae bacterium]